MEDTVVEGGSWDIGRIIYMGTETTGNYDASVAVTGRQNEESRNERV